MFVPLYVALIAASYRLKIVMQDHLPLLPGTSLLANFQAAFGARL